MFREVTAGDVVVGAGTLALAFFTWRLALFTSKLAEETVALDKRNAARERKRRERQVRGIARLVDGELNVVAKSVEHALETGHWWFFLEAPHGAWDRDGALIAETVAEDEALDLITAFSKIGAWQSLVAVIHQRAPDEDSITVQGPAQTTLIDLGPAIEDARRHLADLAYPDARDLEPDPDSEPPPRPAANGA